METKEILKTLRKNQGLSVQDISEKCDISVGVYKAYESGQRNVGVPALCKIADFYGVTVDYLLGRSAPPPPTLEDMLDKCPDLSELEKKFMVVYVKIDRQHRDELVKALKEAASAETEMMPIPVTVEYPLNINKVSAGRGFDLDESQFIEKTFIKPEYEGDFVVQVEGDSMTPDYPDGCYVLIRKYEDGEYPRINDVAIFVVSDDEDGEKEGLIKIWKGNNRLHSINPDYPDKTYGFVYPIGEVLSIIERYHK